MTETAAPKPTGWANYPGDVTAAIVREIESGRAFGPNYMGELMWPVTVDYDADTNRTRIGFTLVAPEQAAS